MKTLYISDLDGTLLNQNAELSGFTVNTLNQLIQKGMYFSIATARTGASVRKIMHGVTLNMPIILLNGVLTYDPVQSKYLRIESISSRGVDDIIETLSAFGINGFMYAIQDHELVTFYKALDTQPLADFYAERCRKYYKSFKCIDNYSFMKHKNTVYCTLLDTFSRLEPVAKHLEAVGNIGHTLFKDSYSENLWYLEIFSVNASKEIAVNDLRRRYRFEKVVGFGDNLNDISLFRACDEKYAVSNAAEMLIRLADKRIGSNQEDGVARYLHSVFGKSCDT